MVPRTFAMMTLSSVLEPESGNPSLYASRKVGSNGKVIAIEPSLKDYETLVPNIKEKGRDNVITLNMAVSDKHGMLGLEFKGMRFHSKSDRLYNVLQSLNTDQSSVKFLKTYIEGGERYVIPSIMQIVSKVYFLAQRSTTAIRMT